MLGPADFIAPSNLAMNVADVPVSTSTMFTGILDYVISTVTSINFIAFFSLFVSLGKIAWNFIVLIMATIGWIFTSFIPWLIWEPWPPTLFNMNKYDSYIEAAFLPWSIRIIMVIADKIGNFPKCFIWYLLDIVGWTIYLPFRFLFWLIDSILNTSLQEGDRYVWHLLNDMDYYIHGPVRNYFLDQYVTMYAGDYMYKSGIRSSSNKPESVKFRKEPNTGMKVPNVTFDPFEYTDVNGDEQEINVQKDKVLTKDKDSLNTGYHIIHFPDLVMETCYQATGFRLAPLKPYPIECFNRFISSFNSPWG